MKNVIKFILWIFCCYLHIAVYAQDYKVLEKSGKRPGWVNGVEENYIITFAFGADAEEAKNGCLKNIREQMASAVAINVSSKTEINIENRNGVSDEKFKTQIVSQSANLPFLQGISLNSATDYYWEKVRDKNNGRIYVGYHVRYPFSKAELNRLVQEYEDMNREIDQNIQKLNTLMAKGTDFSQLLSTYASLKAKEPQLIDDRKDKINALFSRLEGDTPPFRLEILTNDLETVTYSIVNASGKKLKNMPVPKFSSNCAKLKNTSQVNDTVSRIVMDAAICKYTDKPHFILAYALDGGKSVKFNYTINPDINKIDVRPIERVIFKKISNNEWLCSFKLQSLFSNPIEVLKMEFQHENSQPVIIDNINLKIDAKAVYPIERTVKAIEKEQDFSSKGKSFPYVKGIIYYKNTYTGANGVLKFNNQPFVTDW